MLGPTSLGLDRRRWSLARAQPFCIFYAYGIEAQSAGKRRMFIDPKMTL